MYVFSHAKPQHYRNCVLRRTKYVPTKGCPGVQCTPMAVSKRDMSPGVSQPRLVSKARPETEPNCWNQTPGSMQVLEMCIFFCIPYMIYIYYVYI